MGSSLSPAMKISVMLFSFLSVVDSMKAALEMMIDGVRIGDEL